MDIQCDALKWAKLNSNGNYSQNNKSTSKGNHVDSKHGNSRD